MEIKRIFRPGLAFQKAGVVLCELRDAAQHQLALFERRPDRAALMQAMDRINAIWGRGTLKLGAEGTQQDWTMKQEKMSPCYTTAWGELPVAWAV